MTKILMGPVPPGSGGGGGSGGFRPQQRASDELRTNRRIRVPQVRLVLDNGEQVVVDTFEAQRRADDAGLDLVEVSPNARPPVCKIMDYGKYKYQQQKKAAEAKKKQVQIEIKEVKFRPKTDVGDLNTKVNHLRGFLSTGKKAKITVNFRGREIVHPELGFEVAKHVAESLVDVAVIDMPAKREGRAVVMILKPK